MIIHEVTDLSALDWDEIYPAEDKIKWDGRTWSFADIRGHFPGAGGPVIETTDDPKRYFCLHSQIELKFFPFDDSFLGDKAEGKIEFLLPANWTEAQLNDWYEQYTQDRALQEAVRKEMLNS